MNVCGHCGNRTHIDFPDGKLVCEGCENTPRTCDCRPVMAMPAWVRRMHEGKLPLKDMTGGERVA